LFYRAGISERLVNLKNILFFLVLTIFSDKKNISIASNYLSSIRCLARRILAKVGRPMLK
jgi:hypothetical protein